ncbi:MAG: hypothetical protein Ct9H300mP29_8100 [Candidatus Neomarinimicrobiota bacterium]|nr:MAG: hypothetical protein Ct9H300mP29_8100 [Candidatus Neomarinimicrobiota bacterium]
MLKANGFENLRGKIVRLLYGKDSIEIRFNNFVDSIENIEEKMRINFASELLHFTDPQKYWLWTNWIWDPDANTGSLPLVIQDNVDLLSDTNGEIYCKVGEAISYVNAVGHAKIFFQYGQGFIWHRCIIGVCVRCLYVYGF